MELSSNKHRLESICYTTIRRLTKQIRYGPGSLLPKDLLYVYGEEIMQRHRFDEVVYKPDKNYVITVQNNLLDEVEDRTTVVNFMIYIAARLQLYMDTLHLAVHNFDRYLSVQHFEGNNLELLGLSRLVVLPVVCHLKQAEKPPPAWTKKQTSEAYLWLKET